MAHQFGLEKRVLLSTESRGYTITQSTQGNIKTMFEEERIAFESKINSSVLSDSLHTFDPIFVASSLATEYLQNVREIK